MESTLVKVMCISKKETKSYRGQEGNPIDTQVELEVPYDQNSIFYKLSGGTNFMLNTCNQAAADQFVIGKFYDVVISPSQD